MLTFKRTNSSNPDFIALVKKLDEDLAERDGSDHSFYCQFNKVNAIKYALVAYNDELTVGCGAIKEYAPGVMEVKRMYTLPAMRGKGIAARLLEKLEAWAKELSCSSCILETGKRQPEAIALYTKCGYTVIPNYGQYSGIENSVCFEKKLQTLS